MVYPSQLMIMQLTIPVFIHAHPFLIDREHILMSASMDEPVPLLSPHDMPGACQGRVC